MENRLVTVYIDPQMDFCTPNGKYSFPTGALFVPGADKDIQRLAAFHKKNAAKISRSFVTLDSHHLLDVAHPLFWKNSKGQNPSPFTIISVADIENGVWAPSIPSLFKRMLSYVKSLDNSKRYPLCIWPPHCLIGTPGHAVVPELMDALNAWATLKFATIDFVTKGSNPFTEHYSAVKAEVTDPNDSTTQLNKEFIQAIEEADTVLWAGEASSHCVLNTMKDTFDNFGKDAIKKMVLLTDAISPVPGFEKNYDDFLVEMKSKGMQTSTTTDFMK